MIDLCSVFEIDLFSTLLNYAYDESPNIDNKKAIRKILDNGVESDQNQDHYPALKLEASDASALKIFCDLSISQYEKLWLFLDQLSKTKDSRYIGE